MERQSNMELLRLVAMMMILVMHMDYGAFGLPTAESVENAPMTTFGRIFVEHLCLVAVNVYVLISGWFGIRPKMKSFVRLMLQVATYSIIITGAFLLLGKTTFKIGYVTDMLIIGKQYWFVVSYFLLYLVSPILNTFVEHSSNGCCSFSSVSSSFTVGFLVWKNLQAAIPLCPLWVYICWHDM